MRRERAGQGRITDAQAEVNELRGEMEHMREAFARSGGGTTHTRSRQSLAALGEIRHDAWLYRRRYIYERVDAVVGCIHVILV